MKSVFCKRKALQFLLLMIVAVFIIAFIYGGQGLKNEAFASQMISDAIPVFDSFNRLNLMNLQKILIGFNLEDPASIIMDNVFAFSLFEHKDEVIEPQEDLSEAKPIRETKISPQSGAYYDADGVFVKNATTYTFDPNILINENLTFNFKGRGPKILVIHSHSSESYTATDKNYYLPTDPDRTEDINYNVVRVGTELVNVLKDNGIEALHDTSLHDYPSYNGSYKSSLASVEDYLKKYPSIKLVLDIHRDSMVQNDGTKLKLVSDIGGKKAAQVMLLTGSDQGGLTHPDWRENLKFAMKFQKVINEMYPGLTRPISFTKERYNTHTTHGSIIIEVGTTGNTLEEALVSAEMIGNAVVRFINDN